jgi:hypothetical protein
MSQQLDNRSHVKGDQCGPPRSILHQLQIVKRRCFDVCSGHRSDSAARMRDQCRADRAILHRRCIIYGFDAKVDEQKSFRLGEKEQLVQPLHQQCFPVARFQPDRSPLLRRQTLQIPHQAAHAASGTHKEIGQPLAPHMQGPIGGVFPLAIAEAALPQGEAIPASPFLGAGQDGAGGLRVDLDLGDEVVNVVVTPFISQTGHKLDNEIAAVDVFGKDARQY